MKPQNVDLVLLVDSSKSMQPCFDQLREHLKDLLHPLEQTNFRTRFAMLAYCATMQDVGRPYYWHTFVGGDDADGMDLKLYRPGMRVDDYFTYDTSSIVRVLEKLVPRGDEDTLMALDTAVDLPFNPPDTTRRVIALFTDERIEDGVNGSSPVYKIPELIEKLMSRRIQLFVSAPFSPALEQLGSLDRAEIEAVDGGDGLKAVDFKKLLAQMGKSISVSSLQMGPERAWRKALFGQDRFTVHQVDRWAGS